VKTVHVSRRGFLLGALATAGVFGLGVAPARADTASFAPNVWVRLTPDGILHLTCNRSEMGQGIRSSIPALLAHELGADLDRIAVVQAEGDPIYGDQNTDGSRSIRNQYDMLRRMGAVGRTVLEAVGAAYLGVGPGEVVARDHAVVHGASGRSVAFGTLAAAAAAHPVPDPDTVELRPAPPDGWDLPLVDAEAWVTGQAEYAADVQLDGMLTAVVVRPPVLGATVEEVVDGVALAMPGVVAVVQLAGPFGPVGFQPLGGVAVVARDTWTAKKAADALEIRWSTSPHDGTSWAADRAAMVDAVATAGKVRRSVGDADEALGAAADVHAATYVVPHLAHAALEPPAAVVRVTDDRAEVWACVQTPQRARKLVADALGLPKDRVTVHVTFLGAAFGRKSKPDFCVEAARIAREVGRPVRVQWLREDAMRHGYFHASSVQRIEAGFDEGGVLTAWRHRVASPTIASTFVPLMHQLRDSELGQGLSDLPLAVPAVSIETHPVEQHVRIGWLRSVYNINHAFAVQSFLDELAHRQGVPTPDFVTAVLGPSRLLSEDEAGTKISNYGAPLEDHPVDVARYHRVIERVRALAGYDDPAAPGRARGFAVHRSFLTYVAVVVEVSRASGGGPRLERAWVVADPGRIVNRDRVRAQLEGAVIFGATVALYGHVGLVDGRIAEGNFHAHRLLRMHEAPRSIDVELITEGEAPGGIGEPGVPPVAPALTNAWFALTGERIRELPFHRPGST
jgi:isoquinoline 1-oxidoreductase beta subunit